jgi:hypothetical protein
MVLWQRLLRSALTGRYGIFASSLWENKMSNANSYQRVYPSISAYHRQLMLLVCLMMIMGCTSKCEKRLDKFTAAVNATVDSKELQTWAIDIMQRYKQGGEPHEKVPNSLQTFQSNPPSVLVLELDQPKEKIVEIWWRTETGVNGLMVGRPAAQLMTIPETCKREWKPGIIIFCHEGE